MPKSDALIAKEIAKLKNKNQYKQIQKGFFTNLPEIEGFIVEIDVFENNPIFIVINTNEKFKYEKEFVRIENYTFIIINVPDLDSFRLNLTGYLSDIIGYFKEVLQDVKEIDIQKDDGLPLGYDYDDEGNIVINQAEADLARKVFKEYTNLRSIRKVASAVKSSYSVIRDILYDDRYPRMEQKIIPDNYLNRVYQIMRENRKNKQGRITDKRKQFEVTKSRLSSLTRTKATDKLFNKEEKAKEAEDRERN